MSTKFFDRLLRVGSRSSPHPAQSPLRRRLFDEVDHEENEKLFKKELQRDLEKKKRHYNFDFEKEEALEGRWEWKKVATEATCSPSSNLSLETRTDMSELKAEGEKDCLEESLEPQVPVESVIEEGEIVIDTTGVQSDLCCALPDIDCQAETLSQLPKKSQIPGEIICFNYFYINVQNVN